MQTEVRHIDKDCQSTPFFSLILSVYNIKEFLERCVKSILDQQFKNFEVIFVDDGSTDGSSDLCESLANTIENATVIHKSNGGLASARNAGLANAKGEYVLFLDPDDWIDDDLLVSAFQIVKGNPIDVVKYGYKKIANGLTLNIKTPSFNEGLYSGDQIKEIVLPETICSKRLFDYSAIAVTSAWASIYRTKFLLDNQILFESEREILNEDFLFNLAVMIKADSVYVINKPFYNYDFRENSLSKRYIQNMLSRKRKLFNRYKDYLSNADIFERYSEEYYSFCVDGFYATITNECGNYSNENRDTVISRVREILTSSDCKMAIRKCRHRNLKPKGWIIYNLMRICAARTLVTVYSFAKKTHG